MAFIPAPGIVALAVRYTLFGQQVQNTVYIDPAEPVSPSVVSNLAGQLVSAWADNVMPLLSQDLQLREVYAADQTSESGPTWTAAPPGGPLAGGIEAPALPGSVAYCVGFRTVNRGRSFRGRIYLPGLTEGQVTGNVVNAPWSTTLIEAVRDAIVAVTEFGGAHVVVSRYSGGVARTTAVSTPVNFYTASDTSVDSQRRRLNGRGT